MKKYSLDREGSELKVKSFCRGKIDYIPLEDYVNNATDIEQEVYPLFEEYFVKSPESSKDLRFEENESSVKLVYGNVVLGELDHQDVKTAVQNNEKIFGIDYSDILLNTKEYEDYKIQEKEESKIVNKLESVVKDKNFLQKHKVLSALLAAFAFAGSLLLGNYFFSGSDESSGYNSKDYVNGNVERRIVGMEKSLEHFNDQYKQDPNLAMLNVEEVLWFNKQIDKEKLSTESKLRLEKLVEMAKKFKGEFKGGK